MEFEFFFQIALILLSTKLAGDLGVRLGQPSVLGKLIRRYRYRSSCIRLD